MKKVAFHNLGCKVNSYELDIMRQILRQRGFEEVPFREKADIYVVNTCTVTNIADRKSRQMLHRARKQNPDAVVVAVGCYVETDPERVERDDTVDLVIGNNRKTRIGEVLSEYLEEREKREKSGKPAPRGRQERQEGPEGCEDPKKREQRKLSVFDDLSHAPCYEDMRLTDPGHTRAYIKIQDGCNQFCSYCIIPFARGRIRSRAPEEILREVRALAAGGTREIVLTGIHVSSYGLDFPEEGEKAPASVSGSARDSAAPGRDLPETGEKGPGPEGGLPAAGAVRPVRFDPERSGKALLALLRALHETEGIERIRLSSLEPRIMTEPFIAGLASLKKVCPHFHLSLQSGCDATLRRMNRHYTTEEYARSVRLLRRYYDRPAITTDVIVGFPGETEEEFVRTCAFLEEIRFYEIHVFRYSRRSGTVAAKMPDQIPEPVKALRSDRLLALTAAQADSFRGGFAGETECLLLEEICEHEGKKYWVGSTARYVTGAAAVEEFPAGQPGAIVEGRFLKETIPFSRGPALRFSKTGVESVQ